MKALLPALALALLVAQPAPAKDKPAAETSKPAKKKPAAKKPEKPAEKKQPAEARAAAKKKPAAKKPAEDDTIGESYVVKPGDTLGGIANRAKVPRVLIAEANRLPQPWTVRAGQKLKIPRTRHHIVKEGETGFDIAYQYGVPFSAIAVANGLSPKAVIKPGQDLLIPTVLGATPSPAAPADDKPAAMDDDDKPAKPAKKPASAAATDFAWPLEGKVRRGFTGREKRNYHDGIDIVAAEGAAVRAADAGTVIFAGKEPKSFGNLVVIQHANGWQSAYGFLGKITVARGETIKRRERLGLVGNTGKATRDELHFELRKANKPVDPIEILPVKD